MFNKILMVSVGAARLSSLSGDEIIGLVNGLWEDEEISSVPHQSVSLQLGCIVDQSFAGSSCVPTTSPREFIVGANTDQSKDEPRQSIYLRTVTNRLSYLGLG
jgi:hypothetical protein